MPVAGGLPGQGMWAPTGGRGRERRGGEHSETGSRGTGLCWGRRLTMRQAMRGRNRSEAAAEVQERKPRRWRWGWTVGEKA